MKGSEFRTFPTMHIPTFLKAVLVLLCCLTLASKAVAQAAPQPEYIASFDSAKGFKPAQTDLPEIFLQIAGSLENYGSPEPYLRHMKAEHQRIEAKYRQRFGKESKAYWPAYMTDDYFERFADNWKILAPKLGLGALAKNTGHSMRAAINGTRGNGTVLVDVFHKHQARLSASMNARSDEAADFDVLKTELVKCLNFDQTTVQAENLAPAQHEAVDASGKIYTAFVKLFAAVDAGLKLADAEKIKAAILSITIDIGRVAQAELEAGMIEHTLDEPSAPQNKYSAEAETALNDQERKTFAGFLIKARFTKDDFSTLEKFYSAAYDKLSERGKDEMTKRIQAGMRPAR